MYSTGKQQSYRYTPVVTPRLYWKISARQGNANQNYGLAILFFSKIVSINVFLRLENSQAFSYCHLQTLTNVKLENTPANITVKTLMEATAVAVKRATNCLQTGDLVKVHTNVIFKQDK